MADLEVRTKLLEELAPEHVTLVAVSKKKPVADIAALYDAGQRDFGENYVQELTEKQTQLPADIHWHFIGHLQANKVKYISPFVYLIHAVDSYKLLEEINKQALKNNRVIDVLLQVYIANEDTKFGLDEKELNEFLGNYETNSAGLQNVRICGLMGMATNTEDEQQIHAEYAKLNGLFIALSNTTFAGRSYFNTCSMGMSADYKIAIAEGSTMVRIGSMLFGRRMY
ncbi:MAG: alanine racemase domain protein [Flavipsychrobacter sp.]|nr:alanine racemase domain protein [Flavipsychrobacter sp.]